VAHNRTNIRNAVVAALAGINATVLPERRHRIDSSLRPCVIVSCGTDDIDPGLSSMGMPTFDVEHAQQVTCEVHVEAADGEAASEAIDELELEIESALAAAGDLGGIVEILAPVNSELEAETAQDRVIATRSITYTAQWRSAFGSPDTPEA
jgi:hypothetical protein